MEKTEKKSAGKQKQKKKSFITLFFNNISSEFRKIVWPSRSELIKQTVVVIIISLVIGALIFGMDALFSLMQAFFTDLV